MIDLKHNFIVWYFGEFAKTPLYSAMERTTEDSPWHREANVAVHTNMVLAHFMSSSPDWRCEELCCALALAFHDVGKPTAKIECNSKTRGTYLRFSGHEQTSARLWEDYACNQWTTLRDSFGLLPRHIYTIGWMIEYHKPWDIKKPEKLKKLALTINEITTAQSFGSVIMADTRGRIQDDRPTSMHQASNWVSDMEALTDNTIPRTINPEMPELCVLIGPSGIGKSTWATNNTPDHEHYSWDLLRLAWYDTNVATAFQLSCDDSKFVSKTHAEFVRLLKSNKDIVVDNTNLGNKRRAFFITEAKKRGYRIRAVLFPVSCSIAIDRQASRGDKEVPMPVVVSQYMGMQYPLYGDYDTIDICGDNLP